MSKITNFIVLLAFAQLSAIGSAFANSPIQLKKADHFGLTVPDIQQASEFFQKTFGAQVVDEIGPIFVPGGWMTENLNAPEKAVIRDIILLEIPGQFFIELFNWKVKDQNTVQPNNSDIGGNHLGFEVDDIDTARQNLIDMGVKVLGKTKTVKAGPYTIKWVYFLTPWGSSLELVEKEIN